MWRRYRATLRTSDQALATEWFNLLRTSCGKQRALGLDRLHAAIAAGDGAEATRLASSLASLALASPTTPAPTPAAASAAAADPAAAAAGADSSAGAGAPRRGVIEVAARPFNRQSVGWVSQSDESADDVQEV